MRIERDAFYSMLGIAKRAGVLTLGTDGVLSSIAAGSAKFVLLDALASENTKKKFASFNDEGAYRQTVADCYR